MQFRGGPICWVALFLTVPGIQAVDDHGAATSNITEQRASTNNPEVRLFRACLEMYFSMLADCPDHWDSVGTG